VCHLFEILILIAVMLSVTLLRVVTLTTVVAPLLRPML